MKKNAITLLLLAAITIFSSCGNGKNKTDNGNDTGKTSTPGVTGKSLTGAGISALLTSHFDSLGLLFDSGVTIKDNAVQSRPLTAEEQVIAPYRIYPEKLATAMILQLSKPCPAGMNCRPDNSAPDVTLYTALHSAFPPPTFKHDIIPARHTPESSLRYCCLNGGASEDNDATNINTVIFKVTNTVTGKIAYYDINRICPPPNRPGCDSRVMIHFNTPGPGDTTSSYN